MMVRHIFAGLLAPGRQAVVDAELAVGCGLFPDLRIAYWSDSWERFGGRALLTVHSLAAERPRGDTEPLADNDESQFRNAAGIVSQCSHCRRGLRREPERWEWPHSFIERRTNVSHGLCRVCVEVYYPDSGPAQELL